MVSIAIIIASYLAFQSVVATQGGLKPNNGAEGLRLRGSSGTEAATDRLSTGKYLPTAASNSSDHQWPRCFSSYSVSTCETPCVRVIPTEGEPDRVEYLAECSNPPNGFPSNLTRLLSALVVTDIKGPRPFHHVNRTTFANYPHLRTLDVSRNEISSIHQDAFSALAELRFLSLSHNPVQVLPSFANLTRLTFLRMEAMGINEISSVTFRFLPSLTTLRLSSNRITELKADTFNETCRVKILKLNDNLIKTISAFAFRGLASLNDLDLSGNQLTYLPANIYGIRNVTFLWLQRMPSLKTLPEQIYSLELSRAHLTYPSHCCFFKGHRPESTAENLRKGKTLDYFFEFFNCSTWTSNDSTPLYNSYTADLLHRLQDQDVIVRRRRSLHGFGFDNFNLADYFASNDDDDPTAATSSLEPQHVRPDSGDSTAHLPATPPLPSFDEFEVFDNFEYFFETDNTTDTDSPMQDMTDSSSSTPMQLSLRPLRAMPQTSSKQEESEEEEVELTCQADKNSLKAKSQTLEKNGKNWKLFRQTYCPLLIRVRDPNKPRLKNSSSNEMKISWNETVTSKTFVCTPHPSPFNPCEDLMSWLWLRITVWFVVFIGFLANLFVLLVMLFSPRAWDVQRILLLNMAIGDLCVAVYLGMLATVDQITKGDYAKTAIEWQNGSGCKVAGFLSVFGSQFSTAMLLIITLERLYVFVFSYYHHELRRRTIVMAIGCAWLYAIIMAILPLLGVSDYSQVATCVPFKTDGSASLSYLTFLLVSNGVFFFIILGTYTYIYCTMSHRENVSKTNILLARNIAPLVIVSFSCWFPIAFVGLWALFGESSLVNLTGSKVFLVLVYPLNCLANPVMYASAMRRFRNHVFDFLYNRLGIFESQYHKHRASLFAMTSGMISPPGSCAGGPDSNTSSQVDCSRQRMLKLGHSHFPVPIVQLKSESLDRVSVTKPDQQNVTDRDSAYSSSWEDEHQTRTHLLKLLQGLTSARRLPKEVPRCEETNTARFSTSSFGSAASVFMKASDLHRGRNSSEDRN